MRLGVCQVGSTLCDANPWWFLLLLLLWPSSPGCILNANVRQSSLNAGRLHIGVTFNQRSSLESLTVLEQRTTAQVVLELMRTLNPV